MMRDTILNLSQLIARSIDSPIMIMQSMPLAAAPTCVTVMTPSGSFNPKSASTTMKVKLTKGPDLMSFCPIILSEPKNDAFSRVPDKIA